MYIYIYLIIPLSISHIFHIFSTYFPHVVNLWWPPRRSIGWPRCSAGMCRRTTGRAAGNPRPLHGGWVGKKRELLDGEKWWKMVKNGEKWWQIVKNGEKWWKMVKNGEKWWKMAVSPEFHMLKLWFMTLNVVLYGLRLVFRVVTSGD